MSRSHDSQSDTADIHFYFDPMCGWAWLTSKWVREVCRQRHYQVDWRFASLRLINQRVNYDERFPTNYESGHDAGLRLLRMAAAIRADHGTQLIGDLYEGITSAIFEVAPPVDEARFWSHVGTEEHVEPILSSLGLDLRYVAALRDSTWDQVVADETDEALAAAGNDLGTPIVRFRPPDGPAFFGPILSRVPSPDKAVALWDATIELATFPGFSELKRSLRLVRELPVFGTAPNPSFEETWYQGSRRTPTGKTSVPDSDALGDARA